MSVRGERAYPNRAAGTEHSIVTVLRAKNLNPIFLYVDEFWFYNRRTTFACENWLKCVNFLLIFIF